MNWTEFQNEHRNLFDSSGLTPLIFHSEDHWRDFLAHGYLDRTEDPDDFTVEELSDEEYGVFKELVVRYFAANGAFFVPFALKPEDYLEFAGLNSRAIPFGEN